MLLVKQTKFVYKFILLLKQSDIIFIKFIETDVMFINVITVTEKRKYYPFLYLYILRVTFFPFHYVQIGKTLCPINQIPDRY